MSVEGTLDRLSFLLRSAPGVPLSASCMVNRAELLALVEQALADLPPEIDEAQALLRKRKHFLDAAQREADGIVADARRRADELVLTNAVSFRAQAQAAELLAQAREEARRLRIDADDWCDRTLAGLEAEVERTLGQLRRGRLALEQRMAAGPDAAEEGAVIDLRDGRGSRRQAGTGAGAELGTAPDLQ